MISYISSDLEETLILLPLHSVCEILKMLPLLLQSSNQVELVCKLLVFILKINHQTIISNGSLLPNMRQLYKSAMVKVQELRVSCTYLMLP